MLTTNRLVLFESVFEHHGQKSPQKPVQTVYYLTLFGFSGKHI